MKDFASRVRVILPTFMKTGLTRLRFFFFSLSVFWNLAARWRELHKDDTWNLTKENAILLYDLCKIYEESQIADPHFAAELASFNGLNRHKWVIDKAGSLPTGLRVLDAGAGEAPYREFFTHCDYKTHDFAQYHGFEASSRVFGTDKPIVKENWNYSALDYVSDILSIPVPDGSFDVILCTEVFEHIPNPVGAIKEFSRILRPGGRLWITAPLGSGLHQTPYHFYGGFTPYFYKKFLVEANFTISEITANGGFFRHLMQELNRASDILLADKRYNRSNAINGVLQRSLQIIAPTILSKLDDGLLYEDFTVGYFVEAIRQPD